MAQSGWRTVDDGLVESGTSLPIMMAPLKTEDDEIGCSPLYSVHLHQTQTEVKTEVEAPTNNPAEQMKEDLDEEVCGRPELTCDPDRKTEDDEIECSPSLYSAHLHQTQTEVKTEVEAPTNNPADQIKEEPDEEVCGGPELTSNPDPKTEDDEIECSPSLYSAHLHQTQTEVKTEVEAPTNNPADQIKEQPDEEVCGGPELTSNPDPNSYLQQIDCKSSGSLEIKRILNFEPELPFSCDECGQKFRHKTDLNLLMRIHTGETLFSCDECRQRYREKTTLNRHIRIHTEEKPFSCDECGQRFSVKSNLNSHIKLHIGEGPFKCKMCAKVFSEKTNFNRHMRMHTREKPFSCDECGQTFTLKSNLNRHIKLHTGEKPFSCDECGQKFSQKDTLNRHMSIHTGEKPFSCDECGQRFSRRTHLKEHIRIHTGAKPFPCEICGELFRWPSTLKSHMRVHTEVVHLQNFAANL